MYIHTHWTAHTSELSLIELSLSSISSSPKVLNFWPNVTTPTSISVLLKSVDRIYCIVLIACENDNNNNNNNNEIDDHDEEKRTEKSDNMRSLIVCGYDKGK